jgi:hypothetical protein
MLVKRGLDFKRQLLDPDGRLISIDVGGVTVIIPMVLPGLIEYTLVEK